MHQMNLNPWLSMWTNPRKTIREIINIKPRKGMFLLAMIFGLQYMLNFAHSFSLGMYFHPLFILIASIVVSPLLGYFWFYLFGVCLYWTGKIFKGQAKFAQILSSVAWSSVPYIINILMWFLFLATSTFTIFVQYSEGYTFFFISIISLITAVWSLVIILKCLIEVQDYSFWKSIGNYLLSLALYFLVLFIIGSFFAFASYIVATFM